MSKDAIHLSIVLSPDEHRAWSKLAFEDERSLGDFFRRHAVNGLRQSNPVAAAQIDGIRRQHRMSTRGIKFRIVTRDGTCPAIEVRYRAAGDTETLLQRLLRWFRRNPQPA